MHIALRQYRLYNPRSYDESPKSTSLGCMHNTMQCHKDIGEFSLVNNIYIGQGQGLHVTRTRWNSKAKGSVKRPEITYNETYVTWDISPIPGCADPSVCLSAKGSRAIWTNHHLCDQEIRLRPCHGCRNPLFPNIWLRLSNKRNPPRTKSCFVHA